MSQRRHTEIAERLSTSDIATNLYANIIGCGKYESKINVDDHLMSKYVKNRPA